MTWRQRLAPLIAAALAETEGLTLNERRKALRTAWYQSWGPGRDWPYAVWQDECRRQLGHKKPGIGQRGKEPWAGQPSLALGSEEGKRCKE